MATIIAPPTCTSGTSIFEVPFDPEVPGGPCEQHPLWPRLLQSSCNGAYSAEVHKDVCVCVCVCVGERPFPFLQARSTLPCVQWASVQEQSPARARAGRPGEASTAQEEQRQKEGRGQCGDLVTN